jgi:hypothetical protein
VLSWYKYVTHLRLGSLLTLGVYTDTVTDQITLLCACVRAGGYNYNEGKQVLRRNIQKGGGKPGNDTAPTFCSIMHDRLCLTANQSPDNYGVD